ncbi:MAG: hypothetical protein ABJG78_08435 [Cyclobacteriaceae bacterium]
MKNLILIAFCCLMTCLSHAQIKASDVFTKIGKMPDQFDEMYNGGDVADQLTLIYIPGINNPFEKFYMKQKAAKTKKDVLIVGGFKEMMNAMSFESKKKHLQEALSIQYKKGSTVLLDLESELGQLLSLKGYSIINVSKKKNQILSINDYGFDRVEFFKALAAYETK